MKKRKTLSLLLALALALSISTLAFAGEEPVFPELKDFVTIYIELSAPAAYEGQELTIKGDYFEHTPWGPLQGQLIIFKDTGDDYYMHQPVDGELGNPAIYDASQLPEGKYRAVYKVEDYAHSARDYVSFEVVKKPITLDDIYTLLLEILAELRK